MAKSPFESHRVAAYSVVRTLCSFEWGLEDLHNHPRIFGLFMERGKEGSGQVLYEMYSVIERIAFVQGHEEILGNLWWERLDKILKEGPFPTGAGEAMAAIATRST